MSASPRVPLLDLTRQRRQVEGRVRQRVEAVFASQQFILGNAVSEFEAAFVETFQCGHAIGMSSGTDAELAVLMALGIGRGDAILTSPYTFFATAGCIERMGAEIVFADIRPDTMHVAPERVAACLDRMKRAPDGSLRTARGNRLRAIIPVHLFGSVCDMDPLLDMAREADLAVLEDASQAVGAAYPSRAGARQAGSFGLAAWFSFFPTKNLGGAGDGGMTVCQDPDLAERLRAARNHGMTSTYHHETVGGNFRLDALQAAVLGAKLPLLEEWNAQRRRNAALYRKFFSELLDEDAIALPAEPWADSGIGNHHTFHQYVVRVAHRDEVRAHLAAEGIGHAVYYPQPLHLQPCFGRLGYAAGDFPEAERASRETLALPIFPELEEREIRIVAEAVAGAVKKCASAKKTGSR